VGGAARRRRFEVALIAALALATACTDGANGGGGPSAQPQAAGVLPAPSTTLDARPGPDGPFAVGRRTETFVDNSRPTTANGTAPEQPSRTLETVVLYPAEGRPAGAEVPGAPPFVQEGPYPLVVFAHGFTANGPVYVSRLRHWAEAGYVVAAPTFPLSSRGAPGGPNLSDYDEQPADVRFVIDSLLALDDSGDGPLADLIDEEHIAVGGHSLGAITTIGLAFNDCCHDGRVDAVFPVSGIQLPFAGAPDYDEDLPLLLVHGDHDEIVPYAFSGAVYRQAAAPRFLLTLTGAPHTPFFGGPWPVVVDEAVVGFLDRYLKDRPSGLDRLQEAGTTAGVATLRSDTGAS